MNLVFPYNLMRKPQKEMMSDVKKAVENRMHLIADAPTGIGKTIASLFPAMEYALENKKTVFFITSRLSHHRAAVDNLRMLRDKGGKFTSIDITGKRHLCSYDVEDMDSSMFSSFCSSMIKEKRCKYYKNFWSKRNENEKLNAINLIKEKSPMSSQDSKDFVSNSFCAFEVFMEASKTSDVIIGDYFHVFGMGEKMMSRMGKNISDCIIIIDEAHNLSPRLRNHMSAKISTRTCDLASKESREFHYNELGSIIKNISRSIQKMGENHLFGKDEVFIKKDELLHEIKNYDGVIKMLEDASSKVYEEKKISYIDRVALFLKKWKGDDYGYSRVITRSKFMDKNYITLKYDCLDPSNIAKNIINDSHTTILMSGTLSPTEMHRDLLGMNKERTIMKSYESPFPIKNRKNIIVNNITTKYSERTENNYRKIAFLIDECINEINGNSAVFFTSYGMRDEICGLMQPSEKHAILENSRMTKDEKDRIKEELMENADKGAVLFGVLGGSFSEGIDLPGNLLNGVIIIGLPLERPNLSVNSLIDYYQERFNKGREYGYNYPAMIKVMQAAGRCIRNENDTGVVIFADERFLWYNYKKIFPKSWNFSVTSSPAKEIRDFFRPL